MTETKRSTKVLRILTAFLLMAVMVSGALVAMVRSHAATKEEYCYKYLRNNMGLNTAAAAGLLANFEDESGFNPGISGDSGSSYGLCQWNKDRKVELIDYCNSHGLNYSTLYGQLSFLNYELQNKYPELLASLRSTANSSTGAYNAGYRFCYDFERPAAKESKSQTRGSNASRNYFPKYYGTTGNVATTAVTAPATTGGNYVVSTGGSNLNVRNTPSANGTILAQAADGTRLNITQVQNGWGKTTIGGVTGWVAMDYVKAV